MLIIRSLLKTSRREGVCRVLLSLRVPRGLAEEDEKNYCLRGLEYAIIATHSRKRLLCAFTRAIVGLNLSLKGLGTTNIER